MFEIYRHTNRNKTATGYQDLSKCSALNWELRRRFSNDLRLSSQIYHEGAAPNLRRDRSTLGGRQQHQVIGVGMMPMKMLVVRQRRRPLIVRCNFVRLHHRQSPQTRVKMFRAATDWSTLLAQYQPQISAFIDEVLDQRSCQDHSAFETNAKILFVDVSGKPRVEHDRNAALVFGSELAYRQTTRARSGLPIDITKLVARLIVAQQQKIVTGAAAIRSRLSGLQWQEM